MRQFAKNAFLIPLIFLVLLVIIFRAELMALGVRVYSLVDPSASSYIWLGKYYRESAYQNAMQSNIFFRNSIDLFEKKLKTADAAEKTEINHTLGLYYECSLGVPRSLPKAQEYYQTALASASDENKAEYKKDLDRVTGYIKVGANVPSTKCESPYFSLQNLYLDQVKKAGGANSKKK